MRIFWIAPLLLVSASGIAVSKEKGPSRDQLALEKALAGRKAGEPRSCLSARETQNASVHDGVILYRVNAKLTWKNEMHGCRILRADDLIVNRLYGTTRICRGDLAEVVNRTAYFTKGLCSYGEFVPYRKVAATAESNAGSQ